MLPTEPEHPEQVSPHKDASGFGIQAAHPSHVRFGLYEVNLQKCELRKGGLKLKIPHQSFQILALLLEKPGEVVSRETLRRELWPRDVFVNFEGSLNVAMQKLRSVLQDTSREPRYIETIPKVGYRFIAEIESLMPVATKVRDDIAASAHAEIPSVEVAPPDKAAGELSAVPAASDRRLWRRAAAILSLLVVGAATFAAYRHVRRVQHVQETSSQPSRGSPSFVAATNHARRSVAILGFANVSGDAHNLWLSTAFAEMLATELAAGDELRTVAGEHIARAKLELSLPSEDSYTTDTLTRIHKDLGCDYVVTGSYVAIGQEENGRLRLDARVQDALTGETVANIAVAGTRKELFDLASRAGEQLRTKLGVGALSPTESAEVHAALPSNPEAARLYSDALAKLRIYDNVGARDLLEKVIRVQPEYSPAYSALAMAWSALGHDAKATDAMKKAMDLAHNLPQPVRLEIEARYRDLSGDRAEAIEIYSRLQRSYPDNLDYGLELAHAQDAMGKGTEAAATIASLRKSPLVDQNDPRIDLTEAAVASHVGDFKRQQVLVESAARKSERAGARLLLARAKLLGGYASDDLGDFRGALAAYAAAGKTFAEYGDLDDSAVALMSTGGVLLKQGDIAGGRRNLEQALSEFRRNGDQVGVAVALSNLGDSYEAEGNLPKAERLYRASLAIDIKLNRMAKRDLMMCNVAIVLERQGRFREAKDMLQPLEEHLRSAGKKYLLGYATETLGSISEVEGDMPQALHRYQEAAALFKETGDQTGYAGDKRLLGKAFLWEDDFASAKQSLSEALSVDRSIGAEANVDLDQVELAELSLNKAHRWTLPRCAQRSTTCGFGRFLTAKSRQRSCWCESLSDRVSFRRPPEPYRKLPLSPSEATIRLYVLMQR